MCVCVSELIAVVSQLGIEETRQETNLQLLMHGGRPRLVAMAAVIFLASNTSFDMGQPSGPHELSVIFLTDLNALIC